METKLNPTESKTLNESLGMSNEIYKKWSEDMALVCVDRLAETGKLNHKDIARYIMEEIRHKHLGETTSKFSQYELDLFIGGMIMRYLLFPDTEKQIGCAAYAKQMADGLNDY